MTLGPTRVLPPKSLEEAPFCWFGMTLFQRNQMRHTGYMYGQSGGGPCKERPTVEVPQSGALFFPGPRWCCADHAAALCADPSFDLPD